MRTRTHCVHVQIAAVLDANSIGDDGVSKLARQESDNIDAIYYRDGASLPTAGYLIRKARQEMFSLFMREFQPTSTSTILDLGVSDEENSEANILEKYYPYKSKLTCAGLGNGQMILSSYPGIEYIKILAGRPLPFEDGAFDIVYSNAVLEHVGGSEERRHFLKEALRIGRSVFITVPNRWFPIEHHAGIPLLHFNKKIFRSTLRRTRLKHWSEPQNLDFLDKRLLLEEWPGKHPPKTAYTGIKLGPFSSNIAIFGN
jgi:SAM-dependent methyltransferase